MMTVSKKVKTDASNMESTKSNKFVRGMAFGAIAGAGISLLDKSTRVEMMNKMKSATTYVKYYAQNPNDLKAKVQEKTDKLTSMYTQFSLDAKTFSEKVNEFKTLTPQVKTLVTDTKDAFAQSKEEYKTLVKDEEKSKEETYLMPLVPEQLFADNHLN